MMTTTTNDHEPDFTTEFDTEFELEASISFEEILEDDKSYAGAQSLSSEEKQSESTTHNESVKTDILIIHESTREAGQLSFLPEEKPVEKTETLPAVLCDDELLKEIANIPERLAFKIGDVADMLGIKQYVLRYWESEFEILKPRKASNNQRMYSKKDVENAFLIRKLLHRDRFSIEGARQALRALKNHVKKEKTEVQAQTKMNQKILSLNEKLEDLVHDIKKIKELFR